MSLGSDIVTALSALSEADKRDTSKCWEAIGNEIESVYTGLVVGCVMTFDGSSWVDNSTIPGWYACIPENAGQGCPDMVNRFVMGKVVAGGGSTGGANSLSLAIANMPAHSHGGTGGPSTPNTGIQSASHTHYHDHAAFNCGWISHNHTHTATLSTGTILERGVSGAGGPTKVVGTTSTDSSPGTITVSNGNQLTNHYHSINVPAKTSNNQNVSHTHSMQSHTHTISSQGSGTAFDNRPAYYSMVFIRKCA